MKARDKWLLVVLCAVGLAATLGVLFAQERDWEDYRDAHECVRTDEVRLSPVIGTRPGPPARQWLWKCANGEERWHR